MTWRQRTQEWLKTVVLIWAAFFIISEAVERKAKKELRKFRKTKGIKGFMGRWRNYIIKRGRKAG